MGVRTWAAGRPFGRRGLLTGIAALGGASLLAGCGGSVFAGGNRVRYWNLFGGGDGARMLEMEENFRKENPEITLEAVTLSWGAPYYTKLAMAAAGGRAPEVAALHLSRLPGYASGLTDPFDLELLAEFGVRQEDFPEVLWESATIDGKVYAIPLDTHPLVFYVNREHARKADLLASPDELVRIDSPRAFLEALDKLAEANEGALPLGTGNDPSTWWRYFWTFYRQLGGDIVLPVGETVQYDRDKMREVLEFLIEVLDGKRARPTMDLGAAIAGFTDGKVSTFLNGNWELPTLVTAQEERGELDFTMVQVPAVFGSEKLAWADSHCLVLPHQNNRDPEADRRAYRLIASLLKQGMVWAGGGHVPAYLPVQRSEEYLAAKPQANYRKAAELAQLDPSAWFGGAGSDFHNQVGSALDAVVTKQLTPEQGMRQFENAMNKLLRTPSPV
ncbi:MAG TPA: extracellular solute-binding protein [Actinopolymorphaceae bacterium]